MSISVAVINNDETFLSGLARLIHSTQGLKCSGLHANVATALLEFATSVPDVVLMGVNLPNGRGIESLRKIKMACPGTRIVVLSDLGAPQVVIGALSAGAVGYLLKRSSPDQIITAIQNVFHGGSAMTGSITRDLLGLFQQTSLPRHTHPSLSSREQQVLELLAKGRRYKEIAGELSISYATAHTHIRHLYKKLRVNCRTDAVVTHLRQMPVRPALKLRLPKILPSQKEVLFQRAIASKESALAGVA